MTNPVLGQLRPSLGSGTLRVLDEESADAALAFLDDDPVTNVFVVGRIEQALAHGWSLGGQLWGFERAGALIGVCYSGANLVPATDDEGALRTFAERARRQGRRCSSIVGPCDAVGPLWQELERAWGPARDVRTKQPLLSIADAPRVDPDPAVRQVRQDELELLLPACVEMFTEEVGVSPMRGDGGALYRSRVAELIRTGRAFARIEEGEVTFKAEVGAVSAKACQVQGVWVPPHLRGQGLAAPGTAAVVALARADLAPVVSLYVNEFNVAARRAYERVGFEQVGAFTTVLL